MPTSFTNTTLSEGIPMPEQKPSDRSQQATLGEQQKISFLVTACLQNMALPSVFNRELTEADYEIWQKLLAPYPAKAIEYAFDNWGRNSKAFPKPSNILELVAAWNLSNKPEFKSCGQCEDGWIRVYDGRTDGGHTVDPKVGAVRRCSCFSDWVKRKKEAIAA